MKFLKEVDPEATKYQVKPRCIEFALEKVGEEEVSMVGGGGV